MEKIQSNLLRPVPKRAGVYNNVQHIIQKESDPNPIPHYESSIILHNAPRTAADLNSAISTDNIELAVFMCGNCKAIISDTFSYIGINKEMDLLLVSGITEFVVVGNQTFVETDNLFKGSVYVLLSCVECNNDLGLKYLSTNTALDSLRGYYCVKLDKINIYTLGKYVNKSATNPQCQDPTTRELKEELTKTQESMVRLAERLLSLEQDFEKIELKLEREA